MTRYLLKSLKDLSAKLFLSPPLYAHLKESDDKARTAVLEIMQDMITQFRIAQAKSIHRYMDASLADAKQSGIFNDISCRRGCSNCCHQDVAVTEDEALLLAEHAKKTLSDESRQRLANQASWNAKKESWSTKTWEERTCTFLGAEGVCQVYDIRPNACRKFFVTSDPAKCGNDNETAHVVAVPKAEMIWSAALTADPNHGSMASKLAEMMDLI